MGKVLWHTMISLDGFIAGPGDDMERVFGVDGGGGDTLDEVLALRYAVPGTPTA